MIGILRDVWLLPIWLYRQKPRAMTTPGEATATQQQQSIKKNRLSKKKKKSLLATNEVETGEGPAVGATDQDTTIKM